MSFKLSHHAVTRALEMGLDADFIREIVNFPQVRRWNSDRKAWMHLLNGIAAPIADEDGERLVITFLPASEDRWREEEAKRPIPGRAFDEGKWRRNARGKRSGRTGRNH